MYETMDSRKKGIAPVVNFADGLAVAAVSMEWNSYVGSGNLYRLSGTADASCQQGQRQSYDSKWNFWRSGAFSENAGQ